MQKMGSSATIVNNIATSNKEQLTFILKDETQMIRGEFGVVRL